MFVCRYTVSSPLLTSCGLMVYFHVIVLVRAAMQSSFGRVLGLSVAPLLYLILLLAWTLSMAAYLDARIDSLRIASIPGYLFCCFQIIMSIIMKQ